MKKSELRQIIKEEIFKTMNESQSNPIFDLEDQITQFIEEYQQEYDVMEDLADLLLSMHNQINREILNSDDDLDELDEASKEEVENQKELNKELEKTSQLKKDMNLKEMEDDEFDIPEKEPSKADLKKEKGVEATKKEELRKQEKSKLVKAFISQMKEKNIISSDNKILDKDKYDKEWNKAKKEIEDKVKKIK
jgi:hypothetical protein